MNNHTPKPPTEEELAWIRANWTILPEEGKVLGKNGSEIGWESIDQEYITLRISCSNRTIRRAHLVWWAHKGSWPCRMLDHEDRNRINDKVSNLSETTDSGNAKNREQNKGKYPRGVTFVKAKKTKPYKAQIKGRGLGYFATAEEASEKYQQEVGT